MDALGPGNQAGPTRGSWRVALPCGCSGRARGVPFLLFVVAAVEEPGAWGTVIWQISLSGIQIGNAAPWGKIQAHPLPQVSSIAGPFYSLVRRSFHLTRGGVIAPFKG